MGRLIAGFLEQRGFGVGKKLEDCDAVIISVPIGATAQVIRETAPKMKKGSLLIEICSLKSHLRDALEFAKWFDIEILSLHPMFGPGAELDGQNMIFIPVKGGTKTEKAKRFLGEAGFNLTESTIEEHDRKTAVTQALLHFFILKLSEMADEHFTTPNFRRMAKTQSEHPSLVEPLIFENPFFGETLEKFRIRLNQ
ncbi:MAG: prephenate dehydrogenase/arogenate dehydrogenase family protein [archaeon]